MKYLIFFIFLFISAIHFGQDMEYYTKKLKSHPQKDTVRCRLISELLFSYSDILEEKEVYLQELKEICETKLQTNAFHNQYLKYYGDYFFHKAFLLYLEAKPIESIYFLKQALKKHDHVNAKLEKAHDLNYLGIVYINEGNYRLSDHYFKKALVIYQEIGNNVGCLNVLFNLSELYKKKEKFDQAATSLVSALKFAEREKDTFSLCDIYDQLGDLYINQEEISLGEKNIRKGLYLKKKINYRYKFSESYRQLGVAEFKKNNFIKCLNYLDKAFDLAQNENQRATVYVTRGLLLFKMNRFSESKKDLENALLLRKSDNTKCGVYPALASIFYEQGQLEKAEQLAYEAYSIAKYNEFIDKQLEAAEVLVKIYKTSKKYEKALEYAQITSDLMIEINKKENQSAVIKADFNYQNDKKQAEIKLLHQKNRISRLESSQKTTILIFVLVSFIILILFFVQFFLRFRSKKRNELLSAQLLHTQQILSQNQQIAESEIKAIKSQLNPHFFYNALNSIQGFVLTGEQEKASESIGLFSELSRAVLESSRNNEINLHDEIELLNAYLNLEKMRMPKINFHFLIPSELRLFELFLPPMIIQPIVENSVKHGLANKDGEGNISISFNVISNSLYIEIDDDGIGRNASLELNRLKVRKGTSFSSEANLNRIELLNESQQLGITQSIIDKKDENGESLGTKVVIQVPQTPYH